MSSSALAAVLPNNIHQMEKTTEFSPITLRAPLYLRCAAIFIDYMLLVCIPVGWLLFSEFVGDGSVNLTVSSSVWLFVLLFWILDFLGLPLLRGQTLGKMAAGITILRTDGRPVRLGRLLLRNVLGYLITALTLGLGFLISAVNKSGRSLHDFLSGTVVVYGRKRST
jgi:uncharacterized RDD family membrane protein YckC